MAAKTRPRETANTGKRKRASEKPQVAEDDASLKRKVLEREHKVVRELRQERLMGKEVNELLRKIEGNEWDDLDRMIAVVARTAFEEGADVVHNHYRFSPMWAFTGNLSKKGMEEIYNRKRELGKMRGPKKTFKTDRGQFDYDERLKWVWDCDCNGIGRRETAKLLVRFYYAPLDKTPDEWEDCLEKCESYVDYDRKYIRERLDSELVPFAVTLTYAGEWVNLRTGETVPESSPLKALKEPVALEMAQGFTEDLKKQFPRYVKWVSWQRSKYGEVFGCYVKKDGTLWAFRSHNTGAGARKKLVAEEVFTRKKLAAGVDYASLRILPDDTKVITVGEPSGNLQWLHSHDDCDTWEPGKPGEEGEAEATGQEID